MKAYIHKSQIKYETSKATLITLPGTKNKAFWIVDKLIFNTKRDDLLIVYLPEEMSFRVVNYKNKKDKNFSLWDAEDIYECLK